MRFSSLSRTVTYLLAGLGLLALSFGGELSPLSLGMIALGFVGSFFVEGNFVRSPAWSRSVTSVVILLLVVQAARGFSGQGAWLPLAMEFAGWLTISRLCSRRSAQDHQQIAMLAFIQLIAATVLTTDLAYAALFLAFVIVTPWALTLSHLRAEIERNYPVESDARGGTDLGRVLSSRRIVGPRFLLWTSLLSLPMLLMTLALFVAFPRVGLGFVGLSSRRGQHVAGFGNNVELGGFGLIRDDPSVVVRVTTNAAEGGTRPLSGVMRLRGTSFDRYDGRSWTRSPAEPVRMAAIEDYFPLRRMPERGDTAVKIVLERLDIPVLFLPVGTVGIRIPVRGIPGVTRHPVTLLRNHGLDLRYESSDELGLVYDAVLSKDKEDDDVPVSRDTDDGRYLQVPAKHERVVELAKRVAQGLNDPLQIATKLESYLRDNGRFSYSLMQPNTQGRVALDVFLFEAKRGHCEYFATALAIMLRGVGIPSRNVTGFLGGEYNVYGGYHSLRQSDAHSWVEALLPDRGWVTLDPTPASGERRVRTSLFAGVNEMVDAMRAYWMTRVVGYDLRTQIGAIRRLSELWRNFSVPSFSFGGKSGERAASDPSKKSGLDAAAAPLLALLGVVLVLTLLVLRARRRSTGRKLADSAEAARRVYVQLERVLSKKGHARPPHVTAEAHAEALSQAGFPASKAVRELTDTYVGARYGRTALSAERLRDLHKLLKEVKRAA
jgi:transglutaminase-like putative cysteine protease